MKVRALLVGIDAYPDPVPRLHGCVADITAFEALLRARAEAAGDDAEILTLTDGEATRANVIAAFRDHLGKAAEGETALIYYSGHGSQERALPEHLHLEPDGLNETLVLHDSRGPGGFDLADKELAVLVREVSDTGAHVAAILDCCHSGSGLRALDEDGTAVRHAPTQPHVRTADEYLEGAVQAADQQDRAIVSGPSDWVNAGAARYVLLSGCRADQTSKEVVVDGTSRGAMSVALERTLRSTGGAVSYQLIQRSVVAAVRNLAANQTPQLESPVPDDIDQPFLGGAASPTMPLLSVSHDDRRGWVLDAGLIHGIPAVVPGAGATTVELRALDGETAVATATVRSTGPGSSVIDPDTELDKAKTYRAVLRSLPVAPVAVRFGEGADEVGRALAGSALVRAVDGSADLAVTLAGGKLRLSLDGSERALVEDQPAGAAAEMAAMAEHVARWRLLGDRANPATRIDARALGLSILDLNDVEIAPRDGTVTCRYEDGERPSVRVRVRNDSTQRLYYALLVLSEFYGVTSLLQGGGQWLGAGEETFVLDENNAPQVYLEVPEDAERATDVFKLLVSTEEFDAQGLQQADLAPPTPERGARMVERGVSTRPAMPATGDWATAELTLTTVKPGAAVAVGTGAADLAPAVVVESHPAFTATARLASAAESTRDISVPLVPPLLRDEPGLAAPFSFAPVRAVGEEISVLELTDANRAETVTPEQPLVLRVAQPLADGELVLPIAFDGEDYLPVGTGHADAGGTRIDITRLPTVSQEAARSLGGSMRILFRKLVLKRLGFGYEWPKLSLVTFQDDGTPRFDNDEQAVHDAVAGAERVLLVVHGIIGDTRGMAAAVGAAPGLRGDYDAVLAFDYESINTAVPQTAEAMAKRLRAAGFAADDGRKLDVLAHSMGGLVTRWLVEQAGGGELVDKVIFCGTPHAGSPWPRVQDLAGAGIGLALNGLSGLTGPLALATQALGFAVSALERVDVALDDMKPGSEVLAKLAASPQPRVPYIAIAGDAPFGEDGDAGRAKRILAKLGESAVLATLFDEGPNDLAVSVKSATTFGAGWADRPPHLDAHCNHLTYFASEPGLNAVEQALRQG
ncbi:MAG TPA: caspase family protein [Solirubrobacteraceae bacterium]|nr:caspase family protein [Solirubrobacteraceae bacterium]